MAALFPTPKSPPDISYVYGKRQQMVKLQALEREIAILEEELKSLDGVQLASSCCKEIDEFIETTTTDPLLKINHDVVRTNCFQKRPRKKFTSRFPWICCFCCTNMGRPSCSGSCGSHNNEFKDNDSRCFSSSSCRKNCCSKQLCCCFSCNLLNSCFSCNKMKYCFGCGKSCCYTCLLCN